MDKNWCYQYVLRIEQRDGFFDNKAIALPTGDGEQTQRQILLARAWQVGRRLEFSQHALKVRQLFRALFLVFVVIALIGGASAALTALGSTTQPVNVIWSLAGLLLMPTTMLFIWLISLFVSRAKEPWWGPVWEGFTARWMSRFQSFDAWQSWLALARQCGSLRYRLALVSHVVWLVFLLAVLGALMAAFSLKHFTFVWETTWLPTETFVGFALWMAGLSGWLGLSMPDAGAIVASGNAAVDLPDIRHQWANWLVASIFVLGVLPRVVAAGLCLWMVRYLEGRYGPDPETPYARIVLAQWRRDHSPDEHDGPPGQVDRCDNAIHNGSLRRTIANNETALAVMGLDLPAMPPWTQDWPSPTLVNDRQSRADAMSLLERKSIGRLLLLVDAGQTPDRGVISLAQTLATGAGVTRVLLLPRPSGPDRSDLWRARLSKAGLGQPLERISEAGDWLEAKR